MGCDIHLHQEVKIDGVWHHYGLHDVDRDYRLFTKMAGVRDRGMDGVERIDDPRGIPEDATTLTKLDYQHWGVDAHSASWLGAEEIMLLEDWATDTLKGGSLWRTRELFGYLFGNSWGGFTKYPEDRRVYPKIEDIRFVFWFDN